MLSQEIVKRMSARLENFYERDIERSIRTIINTFHDSLADNQRIEIRGFGSFFLKQYSGRKAINPRTGKPVELQLRRIPQFRVSKRLHERLNKNNGTSK